MPILAPATHAGATTRGPTKPIRSRTRAVAAHEPRKTAANKRESCLAEYTRLGQMERARLMGWLRFLMAARAGVVGVDELLALVTSRPFLGEEYK